VGKQTTIFDNVRSRFLRDTYAIVQPTKSRVDLIVKGFKDGVPRGWVYDRATRTFVSDRLNETILPTDLESLASPENPLTFTVVAINTGVRLGIDRDEDGYPDRTEIDAHSDPADPKSVPILLLGIASLPGAVEFSWSSVPGKRYRIESRDELSEQSGWMDSGQEILADGVALKAQVPQLPDYSQRYYRIKDVE